MTKRLPEWDWGASPMFKGARKELAGVKDYKPQQFNSTAPRQPQLRWPLDEKTFPDVIAEVERLTGVKPTAEQIQNVTSPKRKI